MFKNITTVLEHPLVAHALMGSNVGLYLVGFIICQEVGGLIAS